MFLAYFYFDFSDIAKQDDEEDTSSSSSDSDFSDTEESQEMKRWRASHPRNKTKIHPELAALGIYANSIKPKGNWLTRGGYSSRRALRCSLLSG